MADFYRHIDIMSYDFETDTFYFRDKRTKYHSSIDLGDLILDMGEDGCPIGVELLNASKNFGVNKAVMATVKGMKSDIHISREHIEVKIKVFIISRSAEIEKVSVSRGINDVNLRAGQTAMAC